MRFVKVLKANEKSYSWNIPELELGESGFNSIKEAYKDAKAFLKGEGYKVGKLEGAEFSVFDPGDEDQDFLPFDGYGYIEEE